MHIQLSTEDARPSSKDERDMQRRLIKEMADQQTIDQNQNQRLKTKDQQAASGSDVVDIMSRK